MTSSRYKDRLRLLSERLGRDPRTRARQLYEAEKWSLAKITDFFSAQVSDLLDPIPQVTVNSWLRQAGTRMRTRSESRNLALASFRVVPKAQKQPKYHKSSWKKT